MKPEDGEVRFATATTGTSLLESLLVLTVLAVAMIPVAGLYTGGARQTSQSTYLLHAHDHLLGRLRERENRLHGARFRLDRAASLEERTLTTRWAGVPVLLQEEVTVEPTRSVPGLYLIEASLTWEESRGRVMRRCSHALLHLVGDPAAGQEGTE